VHNEPFGEGTESADMTLKKGWRRVGVLTANSKGLRLLVLVPSAQDETLTFGKYHVAGKFEIAEKVNNPAAARKAWKEFRAI
jgi:hypothetical protein